MKKENRLTAYLDRIKSCEAQLKEEQKDKKWALSLYNTRIKEYKQKIKKLKRIYNELQKM
jgi:chromosome segregation ATPase